MEPRNRPLLLGAAICVIAIAATLLAVRLGGSSSPQNDAVLSRFQAATKDARTYRFSMKQEIAGGDAQRFGEYRMTGAVDLETNRSKIVLTTEGRGFDLRCTYIASGDVLFTAVHPSRREELGSPWVRSDAASVVTGSALQVRPDQLYGDAERFFGGVTEDGTEKVDGVTTTRYRGELDLASFLPKSDASPLPSGLGLQVPMVLYIDSEGLLRRLTFAIEPSSGTGVGFETTMRLYDYGKPLEVNEPPADQVKEASPQQTATACFPQL